MTTLLLLLPTIAALLWFVRTRFRGQRHWRWVRRAWLGLGLPVVAGVVLAGRVDLFTSCPREFEALAATLPALPDTAELLAAGLCGIALGLTARMIFRRRIPARLAALVPHDRDETVAAAAMAITAGLVEEAMFRVWLPWLIALATGSAALGFALSTIIFAALHRSQGIPGVLGASVIGAMLAVFYLSTGALWLVVALHAALNLAALLMPERLSSSAASRSERSR